MDKNMWRTSSAFLCVFFVVMTLLTAFFVVPVINSTFQKQHAADIRTALDTETELFKRFIERYRVILDDFSNFPVVTNAILLSSGDDHNFRDLVDNFAIDGKTPRFTFHNIAGEIIYQTNKKQGDSAMQAFPWISDLLDGKAPYRFKLLSQEGARLNFVVSVPVHYLDHVEGVLSAEISTPIFDIFSLNSASDKRAFKLKQGNILIQTDSHEIAIPHEVSRKLEAENIELTLITDNSAILAEQDNLSNLILIVLYLGLGVSFFLFVIVGYKTLIGSQEQQKPSAKLSKKAYVLPMIVVVFGFVVSTAAALFIDHSGQQQRQKEILADNHLDIMTLQQNIDASINALGSLKAFYDASEFVSRDEFELFTTIILNKNQMIDALQWVPEVVSDARGTFETKARQDGLHNFTFNQLDKKGDFVPASGKEKYYPVYYVEPQKKNENLLGIDLGSYPEAIAALNQAKNLRKPVATPTITIGKKSVYGYFS